MKKETLLSNGIACTVKKHRRARRLRITIHRDGSVLLTLPFFVSYKSGIAFLESKAEWIREKSEKYLNDPENILLKGSKNEYAERSSEARALIEKRLEYFGKLYDVTWNRVSIRNQKTRWGSCSRKKDLSFNYRLLYLPGHLRDYVIVHELCHLREFNHSKKFWELVGAAFPDYQKLRHELHLL